MEEGQDESEEIYRGKEEV